VYLLKKLGNSRLQLPILRLSEVMVNSFGAERQALPLREVFEKCFYLSCRLFYTKGWGHWAVSRHLLTDWR
jgi:hypothetical protein